MHQSKKETLSKQWNQKLSFQYNDQLEMEEMDQSESFSREMDSIVQSNPGKSVK